LATDEILLDLVDSRRIVALSLFAPARGSLIADRVGSIDHFVEADVETIMSLEPDLCFLASYNREETRSLLVDSGIPVFVFHNFRSLDDVRDNIRTVGQAVGAEAEAEELIAEMDRKIAWVAQRLPPREQWPCVLVYGESGWATGAGTTQTEIFEAAGLLNAAAEAGISGYAHVSEEEVLSMAPDYFLVVGRTIAMARQKEWLLDNPALAPLEAIRERRFFTLDEALLSTASHHIADSVVELACQAYPNRFPDDEH
jgi:iron complex transport system substrate-binding protein